MGFGGDVEFQEDYTLEDVLNEKGKSIEFEYDFGDGWVHDVKLSSIGEYARGEKPAVKFINGENDCPPEDCGGPFGYSSLLEIRARKLAGKRLTADEKERLEWYGMDRKGYSPEYFDDDEAQAICEDFSV